MLDVVRVVGKEIHTSVAVGGKLSNNKGINKQGGGLSAPALTNKDKADLETAVEIGDAQLSGTQKRIIKQARTLNRAVITATQMMESIMTRPCPPAPRCSTWPTPCSTAPTR